MAMMEIRNVHKTFRTYAKAGLRPGAHKVVSELPVLQGVDLTVEKGDVVAILGPSGSGMTIPSIWLGIVPVLMLLSRL